MNDRWNSDQDDPWDDQSGDDESWDDESWDGESWDGEDDVATLPCPSCGCEVYDDSPRCPSCGEYINWSEAYDRTPSTWRFICRWTAIVLVIALVFPFLMNGLTLLYSLFGGSE